MPSQSIGVYASYFRVTGETRAASQQLMLHGLAQLGSSLLLVGTFTFVLLVLLILSLAAIPGRVGRRKR